MKTVSLLFGYVTSYTEVWIEILDNARSGATEKVTSYTEVWIEIDKDIVVYSRIIVTSYTEVWIEIF